MELPDGIRSLDLSSALARVGGDEELLREIAHIFLDESPNTLDTLRKAAQAGDADTVERTAHTLKGSIGTFGAEIAGGAAFRVEEMGRGRDLTAIQEALTELESAVHDLNADLTKLIAG